MRPNLNRGAIALAAAALAACGAGDVSEEAPAVAPQAASPAPAPQFAAVAPTAALMRGPISAAAFDFWNAVSVTIDADGEHENYPADDEEWERVWSAGVSLAEFANLLRAPPHARDDEEWSRMAREFVEIGLQAARIAETQDFNGVLLYGETILNACNDCHERFAPATPDI